MSILSNNFYYQPLKIDSINTKVYGDFIAKEGDANGRGLLVTLTENGLQKDTTGITLNLKWAHTTVPGLQNLDPFEAVDLTKGLYKITYPTDMLRKGKVDAFIQIIDSGKLIGSRNIKINVEATVGDDTAIESSNEFRALASALVEVQSWNSRIDDVEQEFIDKANNLDATYPTRLVSVETGLEQIETQQIPSKANTTDVRLKNVKLSQSDMTEEFLQQMAGTTPINSIPSDKSITETKFADGIEKWLKKENLFIRSPKKWQYGIGDVALTAPTNRICTPVIDRIPVTPGGQVSLFYTDTTKRIGIKQYDINGVQLSDSGWLAAGTIHTITILGGTVKVGFTGSYVTDATILLDAFQNVEVIAVQGKTIPTYEKSKFDQSKDIENTSLDVTKRFTLHNLFPKDPTKWINGLIGGSPVSNNTNNASTRISMRVEHDSIDVSNVKKIYVNNTSLFDLAIIEIDESRNLIKDSGWLTAEEYDLTPRTSSLYLAFRKKSNAYIYPSEVRNADLYIGILPYDENSSGLSDLKNGMERKLNPLFYPTKTRYVAHRGLSSQAPENTLAAFELAGQNDFWGLETDVMATSDNHLIIMHDDTVDRTTDGTGNVRDLTLTEIRALSIDAGAGIVEYPNEKVPTFEEYLTVCRKYGLVPVIELKGSYFTNEHLDLFVSTLKKQGFEESSIVISFKMAYLDYIRQQTTKIHIQPLLNIGTENIQLVKNLGNSSINTGNLSNMGALVQEAHESGLTVNVNTINDVTVKDQLIIDGVDMITTDVVF